MQGGGSYHNTKSRMRDLASSSWLPAFSWSPPLLSVYQLRYHQPSCLTRLSQWKKPSTTRWRSSINTVVTGTAAIPAYDAIIEPTEVTIVPISSNTAITASAATPWEHGPSLGRECVKNRLCIFVIFIIFSFYCILALNVKLMWLM